MFYILISILVFSVSISALIRWLTSTFADLWTGHFQTRLAQINYEVFSSRAGCTLTVFFVLFHFSGWYKWMQMQIKKCHLLFLSHTFIISPRLLKPPWPHRAGSEWFRFNNNCQGSNQHATKYNRSLTERADEWMLLFTCCCTSAEAAGASWKLSKINNTGAHSTNTHKLSWGCTVWGMRGP